MIPDSTEYIGINAFKDCSNLEDIHFGKNLEVISADAFRGTKWQEEKEWAVAGEKLLAYNGKETEPRIPEEVTQIAPAAFYQCRHLKKIRIPGILLLKED